MDDLRKKVFLQTDFGGKETAGEKYTSHGV